MQYNEISTNKPQKGSKRETLTDKNYILFQIFVFNLSITLMHFLLLSITHLDMQMCLHLSIINEIAQFYLIAQRALVSQDGCSFDLHYQSDISSAQCVDPVSKMPDVNELLAVEAVRQEDIAQMFGIHQSTISRIVKRYEETGECKRLLEQGRERCTTQRDDRYLQLLYYKMTYSKQSKLMKLQENIKENSLGSWFKFKMSC